MENFKSHILGSVSALRVSAPCQRSVSALRVSAPCQRSVSALRVSAPCLSSVSELLDILRGGIKEKWIVRANLLQLDHAKLVLVQNALDHKR